MPAEDTAQPVRQRVQSNRGESASGQRVLAERGAQTALIAEVSRPG